MKTVVVGISASGKSTLARKISQEQNLPLLHLDALWWDKNWTEQSSATVVQKTKVFMKNNNSWVIEGFINEDFAFLLLQADTVIFIDPPGWRAAVNVIKRWIAHPGKPRQEMAKGCNERPSVQFLRMVFLRKERSNLIKLITKYNNKTQSI